MGAAEITLALGGRWHRSYGTARCPTHPDRNPSLSLRDGEDGKLLVRCHAQCDGRDVLAGLSRLGLLDGRQPGEMPRRPKPATPIGRPDDACMSEWAVCLWGEARDAKGTLAERYLAGRGLELDSRAREALRFHPSCPFGEGQRLPCMIALFRDLRSNRPVAVQRTALTPDAEKIGRKMAGPVAGAAVKLDGDDWVELGLVVGEGVESCLAARMLGYRPTWALGSAGAIANLPVLGGIEALTILGEADNANARAARDCARRWLAAGAEVSILDPVGGADANDVVLVAVR